MQQWVTYVDGALSALCFVAGVIFLRTWRRTHDRFYLFFALAFGMLTAHWVALGALHVGEHSAYPYLTRLVAFVMIIAAIFDKNRRAGRD